MTLDSPHPQDFIVFGASGDLAKRKLLPALYNLEASDLLPDGCSVIGYARTEFDDKSFRDFARKAIEEFSRQPLKESIWKRFAARLRYIHNNADGYKKLAADCIEPNRVFYLAVPPDAVQEVVDRLKEADLVKGSRVVVEKPFGTDIDSARKLNHILHSSFSESQIFRIDHYLGKETVQNILIFRFANSVFERVWNRDAVLHIQISVAESIGVEGRGAFYEEVGALRDILENHVLQMLALVTMEPPSSFEAEAIRDEKAKLLMAVRPIDPAKVVRGQYKAGKIDGKKVPGYREEANVAKDSDTDTFVALELQIDNWRWAGVPIYLRTGKRLPSRATEMEIAFKPTPIDYLPDDGQTFEHPNHLIYRIQPDESITFRFLAKEPGPAMEVKQIDMDFSYQKSFMVEPAEAYERLIHDVMHGDRTLFVREDAVERAWEIVQPIIDAPPPIHFYEAGTWGPKEADELVAPSLWHLR